MFLERKNVLRTETKFLEHKRSVRTLNGKHEKFLEHFLVGLQAGWDASPLLELWEGGRAPKEQFCDAAAPRMSPHRDF